MRIESPPSTSSGGSETSDSIRAQILNGADRTYTLTWADQGTEDERITSVEYTSTDVPLKKVVKTLNYALTSGIYVLTDVSEEVVDI